MSEADPLRVLVISHASVVALNQEPFSALAEDGADVTVVAPSALTTDIRGRVRLEELAGSKARLVSLPVVVGGYNRFVGQRGIHLIVYRGLSERVRALRPDIVFVEEEPYSLAALQVSRTGARFVIHENQNIARKLPVPFGFVRSAVLKRAVGATVRNESACELLRSFGFEGPISAFPHGVDPARFAGALPRATLAPPVIGFVGRLVQEKRIMDLIAAVASLRARIDRGSLLVIGDGPLHAEAEARARQLGVPAQFTGALAHDDVPSWYASMDIVAIPSRTTRTWKEQFGRIVIEANAAGVPVIVSDSGELPHTVTKTGGGIIVPESDIERLTEALVGFCEDESWARALARAGRAAVERSFTPRAIARELHRFLREVAAT